MALLEKRMSTPGATCTDTPASDGTFSQNVQRLGFYGQDSWRVTSHLTVNYGLRYEYFTPMFDESNKLTNIIPETGAIVTAKESGSVYDRTLINPEHHDFGLHG